MRTIAIYEFDELSDDAKTNAYSNVLKSTDWKKYREHCLNDIKDEELREESRGLLYNDSIIKITDIDVLWEEVAGKRYYGSIDYAVSWELFTGVSITNLKDVIVTYREDLPLAFTDTAESFRKIIANWVCGCVIIANNEALKLKTYYESATGIKEYCVDHSIEFLEDGTIYE